MGVACGHCATRGSVSRQTSFSHVLDRLRWVQAATLVWLVVGLVLVITGLHQRQGWSFVLGLTAVGAAITTVSGMLLTRRARALRRAEIVLRREAEQAAQAADRAKSEFLANMSHEIRTPMNAALGMTELLLESDLTEDTRQRVEVIQSSAEALLNLVDGVLDFAKIEAGKLELKVAAFELSDLIDSAARILRVRADDKGLRFLLLVAPEVPRRVLGDANRLRQILLNLGSNAVKFTDRGEVQLRVATTAPRDGEPRVIFRISDTGIGIALDEQKRIFGRFVQADSSSARRSGGTGLGLAICRQLAELMGGEIGLESEHGVGSTFSLQIPLASAPVSAPAARSGTLASETHSQRRSATLILVVDDHPANRTVAVSRLEIMGYRAEAAASGQEALDLLAARHFDAVLMDCHMPELDGFETTRRLRSAEPPQRHVPVIAVTADALPETHRRCLDVGMDDYLAKPFRSVDLAEILDRQLLTTTEPMASEVSPGETSADLSAEISAMSALREQKRLRPTVNTLLERGEVHLAALREALAANDFETASREAHGLGGSASMFDGSELAQLCADLEQRLEEPRPGEPASGQLFDPIAQAWQRFAQHLQEVLDDDSATD